MAEGLAEGRTDVSRARGMLKSMDIEELKEVLGAESERVEWKESGRDPKEILQAVCALANDLGATGRIGTVVLGLANNGEAIGADTSDQAIQTLTNRLSSTKILPNPSTSIETVERNGVILLLIRVHPCQVPPVVKVDGVAWVRRGTTTRRATEADLTRLQERRPESRLPFDMRPWHGAALDDLDLGLLRLQYAADQGIYGDSESFPGFEQWLLQRELVRRTKAGWTPTPTGLLVYGITPQQHFPGAAVVEFVRYQGIGFDAPVAGRKTVGGRLSDQVDAVWAQLNAHTVDVPVPAQGARQPYAPLYPVDALRELVVNLVQHRLYEGTHAPGRISWFDDRIVFNNPGQPFGQAAQGEFGEHADYRNPTLTRCLVDLGYVERLGRGVRRVRALLQKNGNPPLQVETDGFTTVTVRRRP